MSRGFGFVIFLLVILTVVAAIHYYLWVRLIRATGLPRPWRELGTILLVLLALSIPATLAFGRSLPPGARALTWPALIWIGVMFLLLVLLGATDAGRALAWLARRLGAGDGAGAAMDPNRRRFVARAIAGATLAVGAGLSALAVRSAVGPIAVRRVEVALGRLHGDSDGTTVVQITDLHVGPTIGRARVADVVSRTNALSPDIIAITGDLVDGSVADLREAVAPLADLRAKHGVFFVTGNHEYFSGAVDWVAELQRLGIRVLRNERVTIGTGDGAFDLAGVDDRSAARYGNGHGENLTAALAGRDRSRAVVLLAHQPRTAIDAAAHDVDLQLSGHTHGGQIWPFGVLVRLQQGFLAGLSRRGNTILYVSRGTGYWGPPMRLAAPAELTQIVLRAARPSATTAT